MGESLEGIYSKEQLDFVHSLPDDTKILKDQLLHLRRLYDISCESNKSWEKECNRHIFDIRDLREYITKLHVENPDSKILIPRALMLSDVGPSANIEGAKLQPSACPVLTLNGVVLERGDKIKLIDIESNGKSMDGVYEVVGSGTWNALDSTDCDDLDPISISHSEDQVSVNLDYIRRKGEELMNKPIDIPVGKSNHARKEDNMHHTTASFDRSPIEVTFSPDDINKWYEKCEKLPVLFLMEIRQVLKLPTRHAVLKTIDSYGEVTFRTENSKSVLTMTSYKDLGAFEYVVELILMQMGEVKELAINDRDMPTVFVLGNVQSKRILHVTAGISGEWEPSQSEIDELTNMFQKADDSIEDSVVVTRNGVNVSIID